MAYRPKTTQERILHRLKITKGQLETILTMVADDAYCVDVLHQLQAIEKAIHETQGVVLENHLKSCVAESIRAGKDKETITEVMEIFRKSH
jgi:DNA-binding FrmR family transcriptional regulator